jgi:pSer/pThr/pTyr-binding forkhead associated (FHA) protein
MGVSYAPEVPPTPEGPPPLVAAPATQPDQGLQGELRIDSGPDVGHTYRIGSTALRLGRSPDNELILRDPATSGHHARLERRGTSFYIIDLGSTNGTLVNGEPVQEKELKHGDRITIGQNAVSFTLL